MSRVSFVFCGLFSVEGSAIGEVSFVSSAGCSSSVEGSATGVGFLFLLQVVLLLKLLQIE